jgi:hypothetical protein
MNSSPLVKQIATLPVPYVLVALYRSESIHRLNSIIGKTRETTCCWMVYRAADNMLLDGLSRGSGRKAISTVRFFAKTDGRQNDAHFYRVCCTVDILCCGVAPPVLFY